MSMIRETSHVLDSVSDTICPWCHIGKKRLADALALIGGEIAFDVRWRPFEPTPDMPHPDMPRQGLDRTACRAAKFGSLGRSRALDAQVAAAAARVPRHAAVHEQPIAAGQAAAIRA